MSELRLAADSFAYCTMMSAFAKVHKWSEVLLLQDQLENANIEKNTILCSAAINACAKGSLWSLAVNFLASMEEDQIQTNLVTFSSAISACERGEWTWALELLEKMSEKVLWPDAIAFSAGISACGKADQWEEVLGSIEIVFGLGARQKSLILVKLVNCFQKSLPCAKALNLFAEMQSRDIRGDSISLMAAMSACEVAGRWEESLILLKQMLNQKLPADGMHVGALVGATLRRQGRAVAVDRLKNVFGKDADASPLFSFLPPPKAVEWHGDEVLCSVEGLVAVNKRSGMVTEDVQLALKNLFTL